MKERGKTKAQLLAELNSARERLAGLEKAPAQPVSPSGDPTLTVAFIQALAQSLKGIVWLFSGSEVLIWWNKNTELVTGYSAGELAGMEASAFVPVEDQPAARRTFARTMSDGTAECDSRLLTRDGRVIPYHFIGQRIL